jgi:hypothetical protein
VWSDFMSNLPPLTTPTMSNKPTFISHEKYRYNCTVTPMMTCPIRHPDVDGPRLEIDNNDADRPEFQIQTKRRRLSPENCGPSLVIDKRGAACLVSRSKHKETKIVKRCVDIHLSIGRHRESYMRTKLVEPEGSKSSTFEERVEPWLTISKRCGVHRRRRNRRGRQR